MENSVTITLARYHDLWDKEQNFKAKLQHELNMKQTEWAREENEMANRYRQSYQKESERVVKMTKEYDELLQENVSLTNSLEKSKNEINFWKRIAILALIVFLIVIWQMLRLTGVL